MKFYQKEIQLAPLSRGFHLISDVILNQFNEIKNIEVGQFQVFIKHTSASLTINENADDSVRTDFENYFNQLVPEINNNFTHVMEGSDDMPAHIKSSILCSSIQIPITKGKLNLGTWQGVFLCEHRNNGGSRKLVLTAFGN